MFIQIMSHFDQLTVILLCFTFHLSYSASDPVDLINFNVYQNGTETYGHLRIPSLQIKSDFFLHKRNATYMLFDIFAKDPYRLVIGGSLSAETEAEGMTFKGRLTSLTHSFTVNLDSRVSSINNTGHKLESRIDFDVPNRINGTYLFNFSAKPYDNPCFPVSFSHNLTTYPPNLIDFDSGFKGSCSNDGTKVDLDLSLKSNEFNWLNTDLKQFVFYNSTGGYESMNATLSSYDIDVIANWIKEPLVKEFKMANFRSKLDKFPSFRIKYLVDDEDKKIFFEKI